MNRKIWKALGIAVCMLALAAPRAMAETHVHMVTAQTNLVTLFETINNTGDNDEHVIELYDDITLTGNYTLTNGKTTTIKGNDYTLRGGYNATIAVSGEGTVLNLGAENYTETLTIDGDKDAPTGPFVDISGGGTVNMYAHVTLQNGQSFGNSSVHVYGENSVFNLLGGVIQNCESKTGLAGAVMVNEQATFNMSGGKIQNCKGSLGGGVLVLNKATFVMSGGTISGCTADVGGGLAASDSTITIEDGTISKCMAGDGGGLYVEGSTVAISGGAISECSATMNNGGGLLVIDSTLNIKGGTIEKNRAVYGGGVALIGETNFGDSITNWTVVGNEAYETGGIGGIGGGIYLENGSMDVSAGSNRIYNNTADGHGADIFLLNDSSTIKLPNAANMGATYRNSGIKIDGWYEDDPPYMPSKDGVAVLSCCAPYFTAASAKVLSTMAE